MKTINIRIDDDKWRRLKRIADGQYRHIRQQAIKVVEDWVDAQTAPSVPSASAQTPIPTPTLAPSATVQTPTPAPAPAVSATATAQMPTFAPAPAVSATATAQMPTPAPSAKAQTPTLAPSGERRGE